MAEKKQNKLDQALSKQGRIYLPEFLDLLSKYRGTAVDKKAEYVRQYAARGQEYDLAIKILARSLFHPGVTFAIQEGAPPYNKMEAPYGNCPNSLFKVLPQIGKICQCPQMIPNTAKREMWFIQQLEGMHPDEAELFIMIKDRTIDTTKYRGITETLFRRAFPDLLPDNTKK
jgi:hypothetical protein